MRKVRKVSAAEARAVHEEVTQIRGFILAEAELLKQSHDARLIMYATITAAIHQAFDIGFSPASFAEIVKSTMGIYTTETPGDD